MLLDNLEREFLRSGIQWNNVSPVGLHPGKDAMSDGEVAHNPIPD